MFDVHHTASGHAIISNNGVSVAKIEPGVNPVMFACVPNMIVALKWAVRELELSGKDTGLIRSVLTKSETNYDG